MVKRNKYRKRLIRVKSTQEGLKIEIYKIEDNGLKNVRTIKENVINVNHQHRNNVTEQRRQCMKVYLL